MILAAQAQSLSNRNMDPTVVTDNVGHLAQFLPAKRWVEITGGIRPWAAIATLLSNDEAADSRSNQR